MDEKRSFLWRVRERVGPQFAPGAGMLSHDGESVREKEAEPSDGAGQGGSGELTSANVS